jgi:hypothetical protein
MEPLACLLAYPLPFQGPVLFATAFHLNFRASGTIIAVLKHGKVNGFMAKNHRAPDFGHLRGALPGAGRFCRSRTKQAK